MVYTYGWGASYHIVIRGHKAPSDRWNRRGDEMTVSLLQRVPPAICCAMVLHAQLPDMPLRSAAQALLCIARIPLIQRREKCPSCKEKCAFTQWFFSVYARSLKDQARKSKYPPTQILDPRTQIKLISHSSATFLPTQSNNLQIGHFAKLYGISPKLYSFLRHPIQLYPRIHIGSPSNSYGFIRSPRVIGEISLLLG